MTDRQIAYREYLKSDHWRSLRLAAFRVHGRKCSRCPATHSLDVHHLIYRHPWELGIVADLCILCRSCHNKEHGTASPITVNEKRFVERISKRKRRKRKMIEIMRKRSKIASHRQSRYFYTKPYSKRRRWSNRGNSSN